MTDPILTELLRLGREQSQTLGQLLGEVSAIRRDAATHERADESRFKAIERRLASLDEGLDEVTGEVEIEKRVEAKTEKGSDRSRAMWIPLACAVLGAVAGSGIAQLIAHFGQR